MPLTDEYLPYGKFSSFAQTIEVMPSGRWQLAVTHIRENQKSCSRDNRKELGRAQYQGYQLSQVNDIGRKKIIL